MRGIDVLEWSTAIEEEIPEAIVDARADTQPIVWLATTIVGASPTNATELSVMRNQLELLRILLRTNA